MKSSKFCKLLMGLAFTFMALVTLVLFLNRQQASEMVAVPFTNEGNVRLDISKAPEATEAEEQPADVLPRPEALSSRAITSSDVRPAEFRGVVLTIVSNAVQCYRHIEVLKSTLLADQNSGNLERSLTGLQARLFEEDLALAALVDPRIDVSKVPGLLAELSRDSNNTDDLSPELLLASVVDPSQPPANPDDHAGSRRLHEHYLSRLEGGQVGYLQAAKALADFVESPGQYLNSDLLKDAWRYMASTTWLADQQREVELERDARLQKLAGAPEQVSAQAERTFLIGAERYAAFVARDLSLHQLAYDEIFAWRFREIHGLDADKLMEALGALRLENPSPPDLSIPTR